MGNITLYYYLILSVYNLMSKKIENIDQTNKEIAKTWIQGRHSCTLILPRSVAKKYGLDEPSHVIVQGVSNGILIRKLDL